jgi:hypothetical protein
MRYITRPTAVRDAREGLLLVRLDVADIQSFPLLRASLIAWAQTREAMEHLTPHRGAQRGRTHYQATLGFERDIGTADALRLVGEWFDVALPKASAVAAAHRDTARLHVHLWIDARQVDGRKIDLSARAWRQLDETWNRIYCRALGLDEREHLAKKWSTERAKQLRRQGREVALPVRKGKSYYRHRDIRGSIYSKEDCGRQRTTETARTPSIGRPAQVGAGGDQRAASSEYRGPSESRGAARLHEPAAQRGQRGLATGELRSAENQPEAAPSRAGAGGGEHQPPGSQPPPRRQEPESHSADRPMHKCDGKPSERAETEHSQAAPSLDTQREDIDEHER